LKARSIHALARKQAAINQINIGFGSYAQIPMLGVVAWRTQSVLTEAREYETLMSQYLWRAAKGEAQNLVIVENQSESLKRLTLWLFRQRRAALPMTSVARPSGHAQEGGAQKRGGKYRSCARPKGKRAWSRSAKPPLSKKRTPHMAGLKRHEGRTAFRPT